LNSLYIIAVSDFTIINIEDNNGEVVEQVDANIIGSKISELTDSEIWIGRSEVR